MVLLNRLQAPLSYHARIIGSKGTEYKGVGWGQETGKTHWALVLIGPK